MSLFDDVVVKAKSAAAAAGKKTGELVEFSKLKIAEAETKHDIDKLFEGLGRAVYKAPRDENEPEFVKNAVNQINLMYEKLRNIQAQIAAVRNQIKCPDCGKVNAADSVFCNKCGREL